MLRLISRAKSPSLPRKVSDSSYNPTPFLSHFQALQCRSRLCRSTRRRATRRRRTPRRCWPAPASSPRRPKVSSVSAYHRSAFFFSVSYNLIDLLPVDAIPSPHLSRQERVAHLDGGGDESVTDPASGPTASAARPGPTSAPTGGCRPPPPQHSPPCSDKAVGDGSEETFVRLIVTSCIADV